MPNTDNTAGPADTAEDQAPSTTADQPAKGWEDLFEGMSPADVRKQLDDALAARDEWKGHSRTWENRSKKAATENDRLATRVAELEAVDHPSTEEVDALKSDNETLHREVALWRELTRLGVDAYAAMDSRSFMDAMSQVHPGSEEFGEAVQTALRALPAHHHLAGETPADSTGQGMRLFERIHGRRPN